MSDSGKAVFLSYASQDAEAAKKICDALRASGVEVWFDAEGGLEHGDEWDAKIRRQIKECVLFIPIISANTQAREEGYFRIEWDLAAERARGIASGVAFILPVVVDDTREPDALVPDRFRMVQWTKLRGGELTPEVKQRFLKLWSHRAGVVKHATENGGRRTEDGGRRREDGAGSTEPSGQVRTDARAAVGKPGMKTYALLAAGVVVLVAALGWWFMRGHEAKSAAPVASAPAAVVEFPRDPDLKRAVKIIYSLDAIEPDFALAEDIIKPALASRPNDPEVVTVAAMVAQEYLTRGFDTSDARRASVQKLAERAVQLAPDNPDALATLGRYLAYMRMQLPRAEQLTRRAIELRPDEPRYYRVLLEIFVRSKTDAEVEAFLAQMVARFPKDALVRYDLARSYKDRNDIVAMEKALDETLALGPVAFASVWKSWVMLAGHGDVAGMKAALDRVPDRQRTNTRVANALSAYGSISGDTAPAIKLLEDLPDTWLTDFNFSGPKALLLGQLHDVAGHRDLARLQFEAALAEIKRMEAESPTDLRPRRAKMWTLLGLGREAEAHAELMLSLEALPRPYLATLNNHWWTGPVRACLLLGEREKAIALLTESASDPTCRLLLRNDFKVDPGMAPFRDDPEIKALLAEPVGPKKEDGGPSFAKATDGAQKTAAAPVDEKSVAVLAFANLSDDKNNEYFSDGISEELLNVLAKVPGLKVSARTSAFYFKGKEVPIPEIARQLGVAYVVEGSVRKAGDKVRITAQLIKAADGFHVWSDTFTRDLKDVFAVQDEIAGLISKNLQLKIGDATRAARPVNPEAHQLYLQGKFFYNQYSFEGAKRAEELLQHAVELDPSFAPAWAALSMAGSLAGGYGNTKQDTEEGYALARRAAEQALRLDPELASAHLALSEVQLSRDFDWQGAAASLRRATALSPNDAELIRRTAQLAYGVGRMEKAASLAAQAVALDPVNPAVRIIHGFALNALGRYPEAEAEFRRVVELNPGAPWGHAGVSLTFTLQGRFDEAAAEARQESSEWSRNYALALALWGQKKQPEADATLAQLIKADAEVAAFQIAGVYAFRGEKDLAFEWLDRAYRQRDPGLSWCKGDPTLGNLLGDPRWPAFLKKLGLADELAL